MPDRRGDRPAGEAANVAGVRGIVRGLAISALATIIAGAVVWLIAKATGTVAIGRAFDDVHAPWIIVVAAAELLSYPAYTIAYRSLAQVHGESR